MKRLVQIVVLLAAVPALVFAQNGQVNINKTTKYPSDSDRPKTVPAKTTAEREVYGRKMLEIAEADAGGLQGGLRAYALYRVAQCYAKTDKKKGIELLDNALTATREIDDDRMKTRGNLQQRILEAMVPLSPQHTEDLLTWVDPGVRSQVINSLLSHYIRAKQFDHAAEMIFSVAQQAEFPYSSGIELMKQLPPEKNDLFTQLFTAALASYRDHAPHGAATGGWSLDGMVTRFADKLPSNLVKDAIAEILAQAEPKEGEKQGVVSVASANGSVSLAQYDFMVFELLPVLRRVDQQEADRLLKKHEELTALLAKYPAGLQSFGDSPGYSYSSGPANAMSRANMDQEARVAKIVSDAEAHPDDALANALALPDKMKRAEALVQIAGNIWKKHESVAKSALRSAVEILSDLKGDDTRLVATSNLDRAAILYMRMGDNDSAKKVVETGMALADDAYKTDTNADDPNRALKAYWPSTDAYCHFLRIAGEISPGWALTELKQISDPEIRAVAETWLAGAWLGVPVGMSVVQEDNKHGGRSMMRIEK